METTNEQKSKTIERAVVVQYHYKYFHTWDKIEEYFDMIDWHAKQGHMLVVEGLLTEVSRLNDRLVTQGKELDTLVKRYLQQEGEIPG